MKTFRSSPFLIAAAVLASAIVIPAATASTHVTPTKFALSGSYSGTASNKVDGSNVALSASGKGTMKLIGAGAITGSGTADSSQQPCSPFGGTGSITGAKGTIAFSVVSGSKGCGDEGGHTFSLVGYFNVTKATGLIAKAKGQLRFTGVYDRDAGTFQIKVAGTLKK